MRSKFRELGALIVDPDTAVVSLLGQLVRAPASTMMMLGANQEQDIIDLDLRNADLDGITLRDLRLPLDVLILSVRRGGQALVSHGHTQLKVGDKITVFGSTAKLGEVRLRFENQDSPLYDRTA